MGSSYIIGIDAKYQWIAVGEMPSTTAIKTPQELRCMFARYGIPEQLVLDNCPQFLLEEF